MQSLGAAILTVTTDARGMRKGNRDVRREADVLRNTLSMAKKYVVGFAAAYSGMRMFRSLRDQMKVIDDVAKKSRKLGMATEELIALRHGAEQSGISINTFDMAMQRMTRRVSEAAIGLGEAKSAIAELGLDPRTLNAIGPTKALYKIADAMKNVNGESNQLRLAFKLFDSEGAALVNMFSDGSRGLEEYRDEAKKLGIIFDSTTAEGVENANNAIDEMNKSLMSIGRDIAVEVAPAFQLFAETVRDLKEELSSLGITNMGRVFYVTIKEMRATLLDFLAFVAEQRDRIMPIGNNYKTEAETFRQYAQKERDDISAFLSETNPQKGGAANQTASIGITPNRSISKEALTELDKMSAKIQEEIDRAKLGDFEYELQQLKKIGASEAAIFDLTMKNAELKGIKEADKMMEEIKKKAKEMAENEFAAADRIREGMKTENELLKDRIAEIEKLHKVGALSSDDAKKALGKIGMKDTVNVSKTSEFLRSGSREAYNTIVRAMSVDPEKRDEKNDRKSIRKAAETIAAKIDQAVNKNQIVAVLERL
jgi:hypothetical protein